MNSHRSCSSIRAWLAMSLAGILLADVAHAQSAEGFGALTLGA
jgi:hypothetical protein